jgi:ABC-type transport system involved in cytochrome c biogenesis permease subunit
VKPANIELLLFLLVTASYAAAWLVHLVGWRRNSAEKTALATYIAWAGITVHVGLLSMRWYLSGHVPFLSAFEFVNFFAFLVMLVFLLFSRSEHNRMLGVFLLPVGLALMLYASLLDRVIEPEIPIFASFLLKLHVLTTLIGYAAWAITFAASVCFLYLDKRGRENPGLFDRLAYKAAFIAFSFLTVGIVTGALWGDRVFGQLWFWDPKETWSFITWLIFMAYLHARYTLDWRGRRAAILAIVGFAAVLFTYVGVDFLLPQIHGRQG